MQISVTEVVFSMIRAQGPGGQNVNKVSNAVPLRFDIRASSLPDFAKTALLTLNERRVSKAGIIVIKAQGHRSLELNKAAALARLNVLLHDVTQLDKPRKASKPSYGSKQRRLAGKALRGQTKALRSKVQD
ncbi:aminoacyl-tRNA hydrolase [Chitinimonas sp. BJB300]|nr:aminoacyl-tRNA hydrolase [Chitinimonas sp. BJB300]TSJ91660.1 aminoacyl-tRNA hydrolase [Chitinimonas sp. BJB300]